MSPFVTCRPVFISQTPVTWRLENDSFRIKRPKHEAGHSRPEMPSLTAGELFCLATNVVFLTLFLTIRSSSLSFFSSIHVIVLRTCFCLLQRQLRRRVVFSDTGDVSEIFSSVFACLVAGAEVTARRRKGVFVSKTVKKIYSTFSIFSLSFGSQLCSCLESLTIVSNSHWPLLRIYLKRTLFLLFFSCFFQSYVIVVNLCINELNIRKFSYSASRPYLFYVDHIRNSCY